jgi:hypothetical protein
MERTPSRRLIRAKEIARPALGLLRFRLRTLLLAITVLCVLVGLHMRRKRFEHEVAARIRPFGGIIFYDYQVDAQENLRASAPSSVPRWLAKFVGDDFFSRPAYLSLGTPEAGDSDLRLIAQLTSLRVLILHCRCVGNEGLAKLAVLTKLRSLRMYGTPVDDEALRIVENMPNLQALDLGYTRITDRSIPLLAKCKRLTRLSLIPSAITRSGKEKLKSALPDCAITWKHEDLEELDQSQGWGVPCERMPAFREDWLRKHRAKQRAAGAP